MLSDGDCERPPEIRDAEITQFTGILDKNGKEIYEGDILEQINFNGEEYLARYEVVFDENYCLKMILGNEKAMQLEGLSAFGNAIKGKLIKGKIIGNIWESPALIGGENGK